MGKNECDAVAIAFEDGESLCAVIIIMEKFLTCTVSFLVIRFKIYHRSSHSHTRFYFINFPSQENHTEKFFEAGEESLTSFSTLHISTFVRRKCIVFKKFVILLKS